MVNIFDFFLSPDKLYQKYLNKIKFIPKETPETFFLSFFDEETKTQLKRTKKPKELLEWFNSLEDVRAASFPDAGFSITYKFYNKGQRVMEVYHSLVCKYFVIEGNGNRIKLTYE